MSPTVFLAVLFAALLHALWNALLKSGVDKHAATIALSFGAVPPAIGCLLYAGLPAWESWPFVLGSVAIHTGYNLTLLNAYRAAEFTQVYPVARGAAPVLTALAGSILLDEHLSPVQAFAVCVIAAGVVSMVFAARDRVGGRSSMSGTGLGWALATSVLIASYSLNDGMGARLAGNSFAFYGLSALITTVTVTIAVSALRPGSVAAVWPRAKGALFVGGPMSFAAYAIVTWGFANAPIAAVSALREVSIVFAMLIGTFVLRERMNWRKAASSFVTLFGVLVLRLAR